MNYWMPETIEELKQALANKDETTYLCAGATDLMLHLRSKSVDSYSLIDLTHVEELKSIKELPEYILIGACVTMSQLEVKQVIVQYVSALAKAASMVGSTQIRNLATIGGNIANASQSADTMPVLLAYDATVIILKENGEQTEKPLYKVVTEEGKLILGQKEALLYIKIQKEDAIAAFDKVGSRKAVTISKINGCIKITKEKDLIQSVSVFLGAVGRRALQAPILEEALLGKNLSEIKEEEIREAIDKQIEANIAKRPSKHYKKSAAFGCVINMLEELQQKGGDL